MEHVTGGIHMRIAVCPSCGMQTLNDYGTYYECSHCGLKLVSGDVTSASSGSTSGSSGSTPSPSGVIAAAPITEPPTDESALILYIGPAEAHLVGVKRYLDKVILPDKVDADSIPLTTIEAEAFKGVAECVETIIVPDSVKTIERYAASNCKKLRYFRLPSTITEIPQGMFNCCGALREVEIPSSVKLIDECAFYCCINLSSFVIPEGVRIIGSDAFTGCGFTEITLPSTLRTLKSGFNSCSRLRRIRILSASIELEEKREYFQNCYSLEEIIIPKGAKINLKVWKKQRGFKAKIIAVKDPSIYDI